MIKLQAYWSKLQIWRIIIPRIEYKNTTTRMEYIPDHVELSQQWPQPWWQSMTPKISTEILYFCKHPWVNILWFLCQYLAYGGHMRTLCLPTGHPGRNAPISKPYCALQSRFWLYLSTQRPLQHSETSVRARSLVVKHLTQTGFLTPDTVCDPCKWTNTVSETEIEASCVRIVEKLISVDQKVSMITWP